MWYILAIILGVAADQALKLWTVANLGLYESAPLLPGIVELMYIQNTGGGFSILTGHTWFLTVVTIIMMLAVAGLLVKKAYSITYGARNLRRTIQKDLEDPISERIIDSFEHPISVINITVENETVCVNTQ